MDSLNDLSRMEGLWLAEKSRSLPPPLVGVEIRYHSESEVLGRLRELLSVTRATLFENEDSEAKAALSIPGWFSDFCTPALSENEMKLWLAEWRSLPSHQQQAFEEKKGWSLLDWLYWMRPENRTWYVIDAVERENDRSSLVLAMTSWPAPLGAVSWMLQAAGASVVEAVE